ncbi:SRPBCC domain-containing protein [Aquicoccus sp. G2-2]|uniref:SRPBCC family protein n=1 Tax=Aquicoccus sp. G2-2 TaxID=3092120 RepID=UPI002ADFC8A5|nr:SRPBCC domain-containing protein [Aquicoccus sp. G2-2]MEA1113996.1 SRPBCC domain-containing protein [Aquicoccus sp. G2-2]
MAELTLTRDFPVPPERLFAALTQQAELLEWWGPEGMHVPEHALDFTREGPWFSVMQGTEGTRYKVSGHVTHVDPPRSVGFTWAWHDESDNRGAESHVTFAVTAHGSGARLTLTHIDLPDGDAAASHEQGWASAFNKLTARLV